MTGEPAEKKQRIEVPRDNPNETECCYYVQRKHRFCRTERRPGSRYCPTHDIERPAEEEVTAHVASPDTDTRVPCPINPNHTVYASRLSKHIKVCPDLRFVSSRLPYYEENKHANNYGCEECVDSPSRPSNSDASACEASGYIAAHKLLPEEHLNSLIARLHACYDNYVVPQVMTTMCPEDSASDLNEISNLIGQEGSVKHGPQHIALLLHISAVLMKNTSGQYKVDGFIELGAGKGGLAIAMQRLLTTYGSHAAPAAEANEAAEGKKTSSSFSQDEQQSCIVKKKLMGKFPFLAHQFLDSSNAAPCYPTIAVIDMQSFRRTGDAKVRHSSLPLQRLRVNIKDLNLTKAFNCAIKGSAQRGRTENWIGIGKHLCGACTEFALGCLTEEELEEQANVSVNGLVFASCCHHRCEFRHMLNPLGKAQRSGCPHLLRLPGTDFSLTAAEFAAVTSMSSWAVSGGVVRSDKQLIGYKCKRIIDAFRVSFLTSQGYTAKLAAYVPSSVTEENVCIVAYR